MNDHFFNEFVIELPHPADEVVAVLASRNIIAGLPLGDNRLLVTATEATTYGDIKMFTQVLNDVLR